MSQVSSSEPLLSLCMIVRDNERTLHDCLASIRPWVDEIVVVDTGSTDATPAIAESYGAKLHFFPWCDDFSKARNESLRLATGRWLFWMDSDDTIDEGSGGKLRKLALETNLEDAPMAFVMQVHCPGNDRQLADATVVDHVKMFRNLPELRFQGRIHEQVLPAIRSRGGEVAWTDIYVVHSGAEHSPEARKGKHDRDLRLIQLELADAPEHTFHWFNLGMTYADMGRHAEAVDALQRSLHFAIAGETHLRKIYALLIGSLSQLGKLAEALEITDQGQQVFPDDPELWFRRGIIEQHLTLHHQAIHSFRRALTPSETRHFASRDAGISGHKARHNLAISYRDLGDLAQEELQWRLVLETVPFHGPAWIGLGECLLRARKLQACEIAIEELTRSVSLGSVTALLRFKLECARDDWVKASERIGAARNQFPGDLHLLQEHCQFLFERQDFTCAERALEELCLLVPDDGAAFHNLGNVRLQLGKLEEAAQAYETSLRVRPNSPLTRQNLDSIHGLSNSDAAVAR